MFGDLDLIPEPEECPDPFHDHGDGCPSCDFPDGVPESHFEE